MIIGTSLVVQWLRLQAPNVGSVGLIPGQGIRTCMLCVLNYSPHAATIWPVQPNRFFFLIYSLGKKKRKDGDDKVQGGQGILGWKCGDCNLRYDSQDGPHWEGTTGESSEKWWWDVLGRGNGQGEGLEVRVCSASEEQKRGPKDRVSWEER